jgi:hypothetical protein
MKLRMGFISNSSSSSFIVIGEDKWEKPIFEKELFSDNIIFIPQTFNRKKNGTDNNFQFGWEEVEYNDFASRLNWAVLCAMYCSARNWKEMLIDVLKKDFGVDDVIINLELDNVAELNGDIYYKNPYNKVFAYIDHQSEPNEKPENAAMFKNKKTLRNWLYSKDSEIIGGNDN